MTAQDLLMTNEELLDNLNLIVNGKLTRAAVLLFHRKSEKWFGGAYVEAWGRGIENMCKLCADYAVKTEYTVHHTS